jgi:hypothetical protein
VPPRVPHRALAGVDRGAGCRSARTTGLVPAEGGICLGGTERKLLGLAPCPMEVARERDKLRSNPAALDWRKTGGRAELLALLTEKLHK